VSDTATEPDLPTRPSHQSTTDDGLGPPAPVPSSRARRTSRRVLLVFVLLAAALVFLLVEGLGSSLDYFDTVSQAYAHRASLGTSTFRLEGTVVPGSIVGTARGSDFSICQGPHVVRVSNVGSPPALFQARIPVVVVGHFSSDTSNRFDSTSILVKHSATYTADYPNRVKAGAPSGPVC
jgi:cytochrome c-type biogenesis protein CcmE